MQLIANPPKWHKKLHTHTHKNVRQKIITVIVFFSLFCVSVCVFHRITYATTHPPPVKPRPSLALVFISSFLPFVSFISLLKGQWTKLHARQPFETNCLSLSLSLLSVNICNYYSVLLLYKNNIFVKLYYNNNNTHTHTCNTSTCGSRIGRQLDDAASWPASFFSSRYIIYCCCSSFVYIFDDGWDTRRVWCVHCETDTQKDKGGIILSLIECSHLE